LNSPEAPPPTPPYKAAIAKVTRATHSGDRATHEAPKELTSEDDTHASGAAEGGGARSPQGAEGAAQRAEGERSSSDRKASEAHQARGRSGKPMSKSGSTPDLLRSPRSNESSLHAVQSSARLISVGYGNRVAAARVVAIVAPTASPMRRLRREAADRGKLIDATEGRRTRSILVLDSDHVVLSAINPETLAARLASGGSGDDA
jgi:regulator of extracellular matrix RemA (YlzA/DUF370 family)